MRAGFGGDFDRHGSSLHVRVAKSGGSDDSEGGPRPTLPGLVGFVGWDSAHHQKLDEADNDSGGGPGPNTRAYIQNFQVIVSRTEGLTIGWKCTSSIPSSGSFGSREA